MSIQKYQETSFTPEQVSLIKTQIAPNATDDELRLFLTHCKRTGLDPFSRQIYAIHRRSRDANGNYVSKMSIQVSIDGFRSIAEKTGDYAGQDEPVFETDDKGNLVCCKVTVHRFRGNTRYPASVGVAYWDEYKQTDFKGNLTSMWAKMPRIMLSKCAEALALRKAYPNELGGLYTSDEMEQAKPMAPTEEMKEELIASLIDLEMTDDKRKIVFESISKCEDISQFEKIKLRLEQFPKAIKLENTLPVIGKPGYKPEPDITKEINRLNKKMKSNV